MPAARPDNQAPRSRSGHGWSCEVLEDRTLLAGAGSSVSDPIVLDSRSVSTPVEVAPGSPLFYEVDPGLILGRGTAGPGARLVASLQAIGFEARLSVLGAGGAVLLRSEGRSAGDPDPLIDEHLAANSAPVYLELESLGGQGRATFSASLTPTTDPFATLAPSPPPVPVLAVGDFRGDGQLDYVGADGVHLNLGEGLFGPPVPGSSLLGSGSAGLIAVGRFDQAPGDDLAAVDLVDSPSAIAIRLGNGDGTFRDAPAAGQPRLDDSDAITAIAVGDFLGDGRDDLAVAFTDTSTTDSAWGVAIFPGKGDGTFQGPITLTLPPGQAVQAIAAGRFDGTGRDDLAVALSDGSFGTGLVETVAVIGTAGDPSLRASAPTPIGGDGFPTALAVSGFDRGGLDGLAITEAGQDPLSGQVAILLPDGDGTFREPEPPIPIGYASYSIAAGHFDGTGRLDLAVGSDDLLPGLGHVTILEGAGDGTFRVASNVKVPEEPIPIAAGDFNGDGRTDLALGDTINGDIETLIDQGGGAFASEPPRDFGAIAVGHFQDGRLPDYVAPDGVHLNAGDGTFAPGAVGPPLLEDGDTPSAIVAGAFGAGGLDDVAVADFSASSIDILEGVGGGMLRTIQSISLGGLHPSAIAAGDFFGDGRRDLAVAASGPEPGAGTVILLENEGDGRFVRAGILAVGGDPRALAAGYFAFDGRLDLAVASAGSSPGTGSVLILANDGGGRLRPSRAISIGSEPVALTTADFNRDGISDLAVVGASSGSGLVTILVGNPDGSFLESSIPLDLNSLPTAIISAAFDGQGNVDLAVAQQYTNEVSILVGDGHGTFAQGGAIQLAGSPFGLASADFGGDGRLDLAIAGPGQAEIDFGNGDGTFRSGNSSLPLGQSPNTVAAGDFDGDGRVDLAVADGGSDQVSILLGNGDGTFRKGAVIPVGDSPVGVVAGDFTGAGRLDLAVTDQDSGDVMILLGDGQGGFRASETIKVGVGAFAIAEGRFAPGGPIDLAVVNLDKDQVTILINRGDGTFEKQTPIPVGVNPIDIVVGDFDGDGLPDLAIADITSNDVEVLRGNGNGSFRAPVATTIGAGTAPLVLAAGKFFGDGKPDGLAVGTISGLLEVLRGDADGTLSVYATGPASTLANALVAGKFSGTDGDQLAVADTTRDDVSVFTILPDGTFSAPTDLLGGLPGTEDSLVAADFNGDGRPDLASAKYQPGNLGVALNEGGGDFVDAGTMGIAPTSPPLLADVTGDGVADVAILGPNGEVLVRQGVAGQPGVFLSPIPGNPDPLHPGSEIASRGVAVVASLSGPFLASLDREDDAISLFRDEGGRFVRFGTLGVAPSAAQILSADLTGTGVDDLIVRDAVDGTVSIFWGDGHGGFAVPATVLSTAVDPAGDPVPNPGVSDVGTADLGDGLLDIVVTDAASGVVTVLRNQGGRRFGPPTTYRAGAGLGEVGGLADPSGIAGLDEPDGAIAAIPGPGGQPEIVVNDPGSDSLAILSSLGDGRFANPVSVALGGRAREIRAVHFGGSLYGLAALVGSELLIFVDSSDGRGGFAGPPTVIDLAGRNLDGLTAASLSEPGRDDLLIGDSFGDVQILIGDGFGNFHMPASASESLAVGPAGVYLSESSRNLVEKVSLAGPIGPVGSASDGLDRPGALAVADLNGDGLPDLIVSNAGGNDLVVYFANPSGGPPMVRTFPTGTEPAGITVADLNGDGIPDVVVADQGSNDVTVLLGQGRGRDWTLVPAGRYAVGSGPTEAAVADLSGDGVPDILVSDGQSDDVRILQGIGTSGTFRDGPSGFRVGIDPGPIIVFKDPTRPAQMDLLTVNAGSNDLSLVLDINGHPVALPDVSSMGLEPTSALLLRADGQIEILVANQADGFLSLFRVALGGLELIETLPPRPDLLNPSALARDEQGNILAANAGGDGVIMLGFQGLLGLGLGPSGDGGFDLSPLATGPASVTLQPLEEAELPLIPMVESTPIGGLREPAEEPSLTETVASVTPGALPNQPILGNRSASGPAALGEPTPGRGQAVAQPFEAMSPSVSGIVAGIDEAFARARDEAARVAPEAGPSTDRLRRRAIEVLDDVLGTWGPLVDGMAGRAPNAAARLIRLGLDGGPGPAVAPGSLGDQASPARDARPDAAEFGPSTSTTPGGPSRAASTALLLIGHPIARIGGLDQGAIIRREETPAGSWRRRKA